MMILVYIENENGQPIKASLEAVNAAKQVAAKSGDAVTAVVTDAVVADAVAAYGADEVIVVAIDAYQPEDYAATLSDIFGKNDAHLLLLGSTREGKELAARVAAQTKSGCITDAMELTESGWVRSIYGGALRETVTCEGKCVVTVRPGTFGKPEMDPSKKAVVKAESMTEGAIKTVIRDVVHELSEDVNLEDAEIIVAGGRGMGSAENFALVHELAQLLGGVVGASRPAIEEGWVPRNRQIGQSGKIVAPKLYIACGISGAMQHASGMSGSGYIVAINKDEEAPIFEIADVGIVGNVTDILPIMIEEIKARKS